MADFLLIDPSARVDYSVDWTDWMAAGDAIATSAWEIAPSGPTLTGETVAGAATQVFVENCVAAGVYRLTNRITTNQGRTDERSIVLRCEER